MSSAIVLPPPSRYQSSAPASTRPRRAAATRTTREQTATSPVPTTSSASTSRSAQSGKDQQTPNRSKAGDSSDKKSASSRGSGKRKGKKKPVVSGFDLEAEATVEKEVFGEEGEPELDMSDTLTVNGLGDGSSKSSEKLEVEDAELPKPKAKGAVIRLVVGKKRKVEEEKVAELDVVQDEGKVEKAVADEAMILEGQGKTEAPKRAARKKRKWLKKGEVDPDDVVAVAKQKERHNLIDAALLDLDKQLQAIEDGNHPSLTWMLDELEGRKNLQLTRLEARYKAEVSDYERMRDHQLRCAKHDWEEFGESLVKSMTIENRRSISKLKHERTALRRQPGSMPNLRAGRGGGGWTLSEDPLLSDGTEKIAPFMVNGVARLKRDVQMGPNALDPSVVNEDLARFRIRIKTPVEKPGKTSVTAASPSAATPVPPAVEGSEPPARIEHNAAPPGGPWSTSNAKGYTRPSYEHFPLYEYVQPAPGPSKRGPSHFYDHEPIKHHAHDPQRYDHPGPSSQQRHYMPPLPSYDTLSSRFDRGNDMESEARQTPTLERPPAHLRDYRDHDSFARPPIGMGLPLPLPPPRPQHPSLRAGMGDLVIPPWNPSTGKTGRPMTQADMPPPRLPR